MSTTEEFDYQAFMQEGSPELGEVHRGPEAREHRRRLAEEKLRKRSQSVGVLGKIQEILEISALGDFLYRGEPQHFENVSSSLYRQFSDIVVEDFDLDVLQQGLVDAIRNYTSQDEDFEILTELQHYGGATNLIDFTADYLIAIFFACDGSDLLEEDGRVVLLRRTNEVNKWIRSPRNPVNRVLAQKSIFVQPPGGLIKPDHVIEIPKELKKPMLGHLRKYHGISTESIYNDLHGFIRNQRLHQGAWKEFYRGFNCQRKADHQHAIEHYTKAIELDPEMLSFVHFNRGNANADLKKYEEALKDYEEAIRRHPEFPDSVFNRANVKADLCRFLEAIADYDDAIRLGAAGARYNKGNALVALGRFEEALQCYREAEATQLRDNGARQNREAVERAIEMIGGRRYEPRFENGSDGWCLWVTVDHLGTAGEPIPIQGRVGNAGGYPGGGGFGGGSGGSVRITGLYKK